MASHSKKAAELFDKYADVYQEKYMDVSKYRDSLVKFCSFLSKEKSSIIELGCGPGNLTKSLLDINSTLEILATDLAPKMVELGKKNVPEANFQILDANELLKVKEKFDGIVCGFCTPYLSKDETIELIKNAAQILHTEGIMYLSTMEDSYSKSDWTGPSDGGPDRLFMYFHESKQLEASFAVNDFELIHKENILYLNQDGTEVNDLIIIAKKSAKREV